jgi:hypothetical protein
VRIRHVVLIVALCVCAADAAGAGFFGSHASDPPRVAALNARAVPTALPQIPTTVPLPTYAPRPFVSPPVTTLSSSPLAPAPQEVGTPLSPPPPPSAPPSVHVPLEQPRPGVATVANVARVRGDRISVSIAPDDSAPRFALLNPTELGNPRLFLVTALQGEWVKVSLPLRPNGSEGWVRASDVDVAPVEDRIDVHLADRTLRWTRRGVVILETSVAIGAAATPTPPGNFYATDLVPQDPRGPLGAWALALNGYSESFVTFDGGDPRLAIHGTNDPGSIGAAASNGCVRIGADDLAKLASGVPLGTPVTIS